LYASTESASSGQIGRWPQSLFSKLAQNASHMNFGGLVQSTEGSPSPPMGSGSFPKEGGGAGAGAAFFANVEYIDQFGRKIAGLLPSLVTNKDCYDVGNIKDASFLYGGPGGCIRR
jgi:Neprosin